jgi:excisionase family DNA binding protein
MKSLNTQRCSIPEPTAQVVDVNSPPPLVAIPEVSGYLGNISRSKVYELVASGQLTRVRIGSRAFVSGESITAFLDKVLTNGGAA